MKAVIQRVLGADVRVDGKTVGKIEKGLLVLLGVMEGDTEREAALMASKISKLRIFEDENGKTNLSLRDIGGELLVVSQFTLYADTKKGRRPSFVKALRPGEAEPLYDYFNNLIEMKYGKLSTGVFGADMKVNLLNDGPVTIIMDTKNRF